MREAAAGRIVADMKLLHGLVALPILLAATPALAAPLPNLGVALTPPASIVVDTSGRYTVRVTNTGNKHATSTTLTIQLPVTATSPQVHVMGTLGARDGRCALSGTRLICGLGTIARNGGFTDVFFDLALPYKVGALTINATATNTAGESNPVNNTLAYTAVPALFSTPITGPLAVRNDHCTGTNLTSFFECALYPSSIAGFDSTLEADGSVTVVDAPPGTTGTWSQSPPHDRLTIAFEDGGGPIGTIDARAVSNGCFQGPMTFVPPSTYTVLYRICPR